MNFRFDINWLRAIAVIAVVAFHFAPEFLPGGFAGVDVFFVISGFLMTQIILSRFENGSFNIYSFYSARAARIIPPLLFLVVVLLVFGWFYLSPKIYRELGIHSFGSLTFLSNIIYWLQIDYFSPAATEKWLLHTWSLSVEWQFYLIYPLLLIFLLKLFSRSCAKLILVALMLLSFLSAVLFNGDSTYYLFHFRAWEMLAGGVVCLYPLDLSNIQRRLLFYLGLALVSVSYGLVNESFAWPGFWTLLPVIGACLILYAKYQVGGLVNSRLLQSIGTYSYSIYLWHWPILVFFSYMGLQEYQYVVAGIVLSVLFGACSYMLVEKRKVARKNVISLMGLFKMPVVIGVVCFSLVGLYIYLSQGIESRSFKYDDSILKQIVMPRRSNGYCFNDFNAGTEFTSSPSCLLGFSQVEPRAILFGDSFAGHYEPFWDVVFRAQGASLDAVTTNWCFPSLSENFTGPITHGSYQQCLNNREYVRSSLEKYQVVIISGMWFNVQKQGFLHEVDDFIEYALSKGVKVVIMPGPVMYDTNVGRRFESSLFADIFKFDISGLVSNNDYYMREIHNHYAKKAGEDPNLIFIPRDVLFNRTGVFDYQGVNVPYSLDSAHISLLGALGVADNFIESALYRTYMKKIIE